MMAVRLREWRQHLGITQQELAAKSGVAWATIKRLEHRTNPDQAQPATRRKLAAALSVSPLDLIGLPPGFEDGAPTN
jgi:transcriptional regulator with XRE-family HTH domain